MRPGLRCVLRRWPVEGPLLARGGCTGGPGDLLLRELSSLHSIRAGDSQQQHLPRAHGAAGAGLQQHLIQEQGSEPAPGTCLNKQWQHDKGARGCNPCEPALAPAPLSRTSSLSPSPSPSSYPSPSAYALEHSARRPASADAASQGSGTEGVPGWMLNQKHRAALQGSGADGVAGWEHQNHRALEHLGTRGQQQQGRSGLPTGCTRGAPGRPWAAPEGACAFARPPLGVMGQGPGYAFFSSFPQAARAALAEEAAEGQEGGGEQERGEGQGAGERREEEEGEGGQARAADNTGPVEDVIAVKAFYVARSLDLRSITNGPFRAQQSSLYTARNNVIITFADPPRLPSSAPAASDQPGRPSLEERYLVAYQYGAVILFNFSQEQQQEALDVVASLATHPFKATFKDDYGVILRPTLVAWSEGGYDHVVVQRLDTNNIRIISSVLAQSVALDYYSRKVDDMVTTFRELNQGMEQTGTFTMTRKKLFQLVAAANTTLADVILRIGLLERSDTAWRYAQYSQIWEYMRDDFELEERFESLDFKLNIIQHNVRFFLDILQNRKSDTLEWIIILLITGEICVSLYEILHTAMRAGGS